MLKIMEYRRQLKALKDEGNEIIVKAESETRDMNESEQTRFAAINTEMDAIEARMDSYIKINRISEDELRTYAVAKPEPEKPNDADGRFGTIGEFLTAVAQAEYPGATRDNRLVWEGRAVSGASEGIPSEGGFLVGTDHVAELIKPIHENGVLLSRVRKLPISNTSNAITINAVDETSRATGSRWGGVQVYWAAEGGTATAKKPVFRQIEQKLKKLMGICYATDELLTDAAALGSVITQAFAEEFDWVLNDGIINGLGAGQLLGFMNADCKKQVSKETGQAATTIVSDNIRKMYMAMPGRNRARGIWIYNQDCEVQLETLTDTIGAGGVLAKLWNMQAGTLMGKPAFPMEQCQTLGTTGDICFIDPSEYLFSDKGGLQTATSIHVRFLYDEQTFRFVYRCAGQPIPNSTITAGRGSATYSPFVALQTRS